MRPEKSYLVCSLPRSGSWLLSFALEDTGLLGQPYPYFCPRVLDYCSATWFLPSPPPLHDYIDAIMKNSTTADGILGAKIEWFDLVNLMELAGNEWSVDTTGQERQVLEELLGDVQLIYLERRDKVREAVSFCRALETREWARPADNSTSWPDGEPDFEWFDEVFDLLMKEDTEWAQFFQRNGYQPFRVEYEEYTRDQHSFGTTVLGILEYLGVSVPAKFVPPQPRQRRQSNDTSEEIVRHYRQWRSRNDSAAERIA
jgi:LPS sulfotransferase NodH